MQEHEVTVKLTVWASTQAEALAEVLKDPVPPAEDHHALTVRESNVKTTKAR